MNAPLIWIGAPGIIALLLFLLRRWHRLTVLAGVLACLTLAGLAWLVPIEKLITLGALSFRISDTFSILGRRFILEDADRPMLTIIYFVSSFWFGAAHISQAGRRFVPMGLAIVALLIAAIAVEPFLYAVLIIEIAALISVPMLFVTGKPTQRGILRYITFQTLGVPFILITEWMVTGAETTPADITLVVQAAALLGFGFAFLLAVTPFHTWVVMLAEESNPYAVAFIATMLPLMITLFGLGFLDRYAWLRGSELVQFVVRLAGLLLALTGGIGIAFQTRLDRNLSFALLIETGLSLISLGLPPEGYIIYFGMLLPKAIAFGVWALSLSILNEKGQSLSSLNLAGIARQKPIAATGLILAQLSVAGFPLLAGFPVRLALWQTLARVSAIQSSLGLLACAGLFFSALRTLAVMVAGSDEQDWRRMESWQSVWLLGSGIVALLIIGMFPELFLPLFVNGLNSFGHLLP